MNIIRISTNDLVSLHEVYDVVESIHHSKAFKQYLKNQIINDSTYLALPDNVYIQFNNYLVSAIKSEVYIESGLFLNLLHKPSTKLNNAHFVCGCGKGYASYFDHLCKLCREDVHVGTRREMKLYGISHRGNGLSLYDYVTYLNNN